MFTVLNTVQNFNDNFGFVKLICCHVIQKVEVNKLL